MIEKHISINAAARQAGVHWLTMRRWLIKEFGIMFPRVKRGEKILVREKDVEYLLARRRDSRNLMKRHSKATR